MIILDENLKIALLNDHPLWIMILLRKQMGESGYNKQDLLTIVDKSIEHYENIDKAVEQHIVDEANHIPEGNFGYDPSDEGR